mmetsp:Transcript_9559/g.12512  ORF Transcript_9559/g.12512 Transcript_9559/m.12512 type:complete len:82 (+) Transcript_9559:107-352(+)
MQNKTAENAIATAIMWISFFFLKVIKQSTIYKHFNQLLDGHTFEWPEVFLIFMTSVKASRHIGQFFDLRGSCFAHSSQRHT